MTGKLLTLGYREFTDWEKKFVARLLEAPFQGRDELKIQMGNALVRPADKDGCLEFFSHSEVRAEVPFRVPVEAETEDHDGVGIHALLHVVDGIARELEFYKDDGTAISSMPDPSRWRVLPLADSE